MKKRKRKLTEEQRRAAIRREAERIEAGKLNRKRLLVQRSATGLLYIRKIHPHSDNPRIVAMGLAQELFDYPSRGAQSLGWIMERRGKDKRFLGQMLIELGKYLTKGQPMFDKVDIDIADIIRRQPCIRFSEIVSKLEELYPSNYTRASLEKRVTRLGLKHIPREYLEPPL
jgi:hypothetical protein